MSLVTEIEFINDPEARSYLEGLDIQLHDYLTDDADWNAEYWDFDADYLDEYAKLMETLYSKSANGIEFQALWAGETPKKMVELPIEKLLEIIECNQISTGARYVVRKGA
jgi:hypothetical protein